MSEILAENTWQLYLNFEQVFYLLQKTYIFK